MPPAQVRLQRGVGLAAPGIPTTLLIDRQGRELGRVVGPAEWDSPEVEVVIRKYLAGNAAEPHH